MSKATIADLEIRGLTAQVKRFMDCELCGRDRGGLYLIGLEGSKLSVCKNCTKHGKILEEPAQLPQKFAGLPVALKQKTNAQNFVKAAKGDEPDELLDNYGQIVRKAREKTGLSQEDFARKINETMNVIKKVEAGKMVPPDNLAKRIERFAGIKLFGKPVKE